MKGHRGGGTQEGLRSTARAWCTANWSGLLRTYYLRRAVVAYWRRAWVIEGGVYIERNGTLEVPNNVMNSTDTCPCTTDRHHERPRPVQLPARQRNATRRQWSCQTTQPAEEGSPRRGSQSPPQSSSKPPGSAERCEWLSAAMRRAGRLAMRPEPFWLKMHSALPTPRLKEQKEAQPAITEVMSDACHNTWGCL